MSRFLAEKNAVAPRTSRSTVQHLNHLATE